MTCDNNTKTYFCLQMTSMKFFELKPMDRVRMDMTRAWYKLAQKKLLRSMRNMNEGCVPYEFFKYLFLV